MKRIGKKIVNLKKNFPIWISLYIIFSLHVNLNFDYSNTSFLEQIKSYVPNYSIWPVLLFPLLLVFTKKTLLIHEETFFEYLYTVIPASLFAFFMVFGESFEKTNSWQLVLGNSFQIGKSALKFSGYFLLFFLLIQWIYARLKSYSIRTTSWTPKSLQKYCAMLEKNPFITTFVTLFVFWQIIRNS